MVGKNLKMPNLIFEIENRLQTFYFGIEYKRNDRNVEIDDSKYLENVYIYIVLKSLKTFVSCKWTPVFVMVIFGSDMLYVINIFVRENLSFVMF